MKEDFIQATALELKLLRIENNDLQEELAIKSSVAMSTISKYEKGCKNMNLKKIQQIIKPYNIDLFIFFNRILAKTQEINKSE